MKRETLAELFKAANIEAPKDVVDKIMAENGNDIEAEKAKVTQAEANFAAEKSKAAGLATQLADRDKDIETLKGQAGNSAELQTKLTELQTKYTNDTKNLQTQLDTEKTEAQKKLDAQKTDFAIEKFFAPLPFASELARKAAIAEFKTKDFKTDESGKFLGATEWLEDLKKNDAAAFKAEEGENTPPPAFVGAAGGAGTPPGSGASGAFKGFGFTHIREPKKE